MTEPQVDMKLEVIVLGVSDVGRAKAFYEKLGWRLDIDVAAGEFRGVQLTPPHSEASIIFGKGATSPEPGAVRSLVLTVNDIDAARADLMARGVARRDAPSIRSLGGSRRTLRTPAFSSVSTARETFPK